MLVLSRLIRMVMSPSLRLDGSVGVFRISMDGSNKRTLPRLRGMVFALSINRLLVPCEICCIWTLKLRSFRESANLSRRAVIIQIPSDLGLPPYLVGYCMNKFIRACGLVPTMYLCLL